MSFTTAILYSTGGYLVLLVTLGLFARRQRESNNLKDFYLAGSGLGSFVLLLTLYATQYSANTMLVTPAEVVNQGMGMILVLGYMTAIVVFYLTFAPQLYEVSRRNNFVTPGDWFDYRFNMPALSLLANMVLILVSVNFLLSQLIAMGHITSGITGGAIPYWGGVVFLALIVIIYETLGGMRAVAWTDVIQGLMLLLGLGGIFLMVMPGPSELAEISTWLMENEPAKIQVPDGSFRLYWASTVVMLGLGAAVYPQVIQRIYAARSANVLKKSLGAMVVMPLVTVLILFLLGIVSIPHFTGIEDIPTDEVLPVMLSVWSKSSPITFIMAVMVTLGLLAAIMSTADSVLLSMSSIVAKDILGKSIMKNNTEQTLTRTGMIFSWTIMGVLVLLALNPDITLWGLIELKMQLLVQVSPLFLVGLYRPDIHARSMFAGLIVGVAVALATFVFGLKTIGYIQAGLVAFSANMLAIWLHHQWSLRCLSISGSAR